MRVNRADGVTGCLVSGKGKAHFSLCEIPGAATDGPSREQGWRPAHWSVRRKSHGRVACAGGGCLLPRWRACPVSPRTWTLFSLPDFYWSLEKLALILSVFVGDLSSPSTCLFLLCPSVSLYPRSTSCSSILKMS